MASRQEDLPMTKRTACIVLLFCAMAVSSSAQNFTTIADFDLTDGSGPTFGYLVQGFNGSLYGTTFAGAPTSFCGQDVGGCGAIFGITPAGSLATVYAFCSQPNCTDGDAPFSGVVQASDGNLYGITYFGGANCPPYGCGTVFKVTPGGTLTTLYSFCSQRDCADGDSPRGQMVEAADGSFYGTTFYGGANQECYLGCGTVFRVTSEGVFTRIHSFCSLPGCADGNWPTSGLIQGRDGSIYGATDYSGGYALGGAVFKITPGGTFTTLHTFCSQSGCVDGAAPFYAALVQTPDGDLYGTTEFGGTEDYGTIFKITAQGDFETLYSFNKADDGAYPVAGLIQATDGNLYGTTSAGGNDECAGFQDGCGTVFKMTQSGTVTILHKFDGIDGDSPYAGLVQATDGNLYGTTETGLSQAGSLYGTVFSLSMGLGPFVETLPIYGATGGNVVILGNNLTGSTAVSFNGTAALFTVVSDTEITATVPSGATTGFVTVATATGTLKSNKPFQIIP
jgi:uncharacterized repeat protein (TIGR03803 family)